MRVVIKRNHLQAKLAPHGPDVVRLATTRPGPQGLSAYELWLQEGNSGTVQDFLNAISGTPVSFPGYQDYPPDSLIDTFERVIDRKAERSEVAVMDGGNF